MISLNSASLIVDNALAHARELRLKPLTVAVLDAGGHLVALKREDDASLLRPDIAVAKAWGALGMGVGSRALAARAASHPHFFAAVTAMAAGRVVPVPGGVIVRTQSGVPIGAVGVSGDLPEADEACAMAGIVAAQLVADPGA
jgi:uncharacterized protein GlcG (DUF336 family)